FHAIHCIINAHHFSWEGLAANDHWRILGVFLSFSCFRGLLGFDGFFNQRLSTGSGWKAAGSLVDSDRGVVAAVNLALVACLAQAFKQFSERDVESGELVSATSFSSNCWATANDSQFNGQCSALITSVCFFEDLDVDTLYFRSQLVNLGDFLINILPETIRNGDVASAVVQLHGVLQ